MIACYSSQSGLLNLFPNCLENAFQFLYSVVQLAAQLDQIPNRLTASLPDRRGIRTSSLVSDSIRHNC